MDAVKSWRVPSFAQRHSVSTAFIYAEIAAGRLRARKAGPKATIICAEDEEAWLSAMPDARTANIEAA